MTETKDTNPKDAIGIRKVPGSVVPRNVLGEVALGLLEGACKYGRHNYRVFGVRASVYFDACVARHLDAWWEGQDIDPASGIHHVSKAIAGLFVLRDAMLRGMMIDDRPPPTPENWIDDLNKRAAEILDRYPNPEPAWTAERVAAKATPGAAPEPEPEPEPESDDAYRGRLRAAWGRKFPTLRWEDRVYVKSSSAYAIEHLDGNDLDEFVAQRSDFLPARNT